MGTARVASARLPEHIWAALDEYRDREGATTAQAIIHYLEAGMALETGFARLTGSIDRLSDEIAALAEEAARSNKEMGVTRKNIGKATRASYGSLSLLAWLYHDFLVSLAAQLEGAGEGGTPVGVRASALAAGPVDDIFKLFEMSGGALQADRDTRYFPSFKGAEDRARFRGRPPEELFGSSEETWRRLTSPGNDAEVLSKLRGGADA